MTLNEFSRGSNFVIAVAVILVAVVAIAITTTYFITAAYSAMAAAGEQQQQQTVRVQAGTGVDSSAITVFSPQQVEVKSGESVTWYNPTPVAEPHTVTFVLDNKSMTDIVAPFAIPSNSTKLMPLIPNSNTEPLMTPDGNAIIAVNKRGYNPVIIDSTSKVTYMKQNANYTMTGTEKYVSSGWLLPKGLEHVYPGSGNTFTITFQKAGTYDYVCLIHPYMKGKVVVK